MSCSYHIGNTVLQLLELYMAAMAKIDVDEMPDTTDRNRELRIALKIKEWQQIMDKRLPSFAAWMSTRRYASGVCAIPDVGHDGFLSECVCFERSLHFAEASVACFIVRTGQRLFVVV